MHGRVDAPSPHMRAPWLVRLTLVEVGRAVEVGPGPVELRAV